MNRTNILTALAAIAIAVAGYLLIRPALSPRAVPPPPAASGGGDLKALIKPLAEKLQREPANGEGWLLLARTHAELRQPVEAAAAYARAAALLPPNAAMLADWADTLVVARDRKWDNESRDIVKRALAIDPRHLKTLALAGSEAFDRGDRGAAIRFWKTLKAAAPPESMYAKLAEENIKQAETALPGQR